MNANNLPDLFEKSTARFADNSFMWEKKDTRYKALTYSETRTRVHNYAAGLLKLGLAKGDRVALISEGRNDWITSELAVLYCGGVSVPLSVKIEEDSDLTFRLSHSGCKGIIISGNHMHKAFRLAGQLPELKFIILLDGLPDEEYKYIQHWATVPKDKIEVLGVEDVVRNGAEILTVDNDKITRLAETIQPDDYANICYTSGTTADPKGIILTHKNYLANTWQSSGLFEIPEYYTMLHILPWDHSFAHTVGIYTLMRNGASLASLKLGKTANETLRNIPINIKEVRPYAMLSVPALAKNFKNNIEKGVSEKGEFTRKLFKMAMKTAITYNREGYNKGTGFRFMLKPLYSLFDKIIFSKIRQNFGGRLKFFVGGGALLDLELQRFYYALGMPMYQGYGLTEASPVISSNTPDHHKLGSSGKLVPYMELKICNEDGEELPVGEKGEIVIKGENVMAGYWNNPKATKDTIRDGWLHTGDLGYMDRDGYLFVMGRNKSLLISSDGEKFSPEGIEEAMVEKSAFIDQVMLYNNQNPYTTALIYPNKKAIRDWAKKSDIELNSAEGQKAALLKLQHEVNRFLPAGDLAGLFPPRWLPSAVWVMKETFNEQNKMINSTMKMVRPAITEHYKEAIKYLYTPEAKDMCNSNNLSNMEALFTEEN